ncbi:MAG: hypothetical protein IJ752_03945 [Alphaproteobacteria bacterium]|nr:hypothetical protein [Alphaproteobacteria bacterium]
MKKIARIFYVFAAVLMLNACASAPKDVVLARSDDFSSRPKWANEEKTFTIEKGTVYMLGTHEMPVAGKRISTGYRIAENNAKAGLSGAIEQRLNFIFQNAEEGDGMGADQTRFIGGETSKLTASSIRPANRYWEKVAVVVDADGTQDVIYRIFVRVSMPEADFKKAVQEAIKRNSGKKGISEDFAKKVEAHWDQMSE